ncbi:hypothetical protein AK88_04273, partial [Plasmodium fragile]
YFAHLAKRRRKFRTVRDVPSPPLDEEILDHLQRGDLPPPDYGYTMIRARQPASAAPRRGIRPPRVHKRTIIELHLEVLHECEEAEWQNVKDDYWQILVEQFVQELMRDEDTNNNILGVSTSNHGLPGTHVSSTDSKGTDPCPFDEYHPCKCIETIPLAMDTSTRHAQDPDPWKCMETIQFDAEHNAHSNPDHVTSYCIHWINWIHRNKHLLQECTTQPWFLQLKANWKQYL